MLPFSFKFKNKQFINKTIKKGETII